MSISALSPAPRRLALIPALAAIVLAPLALAAQDLPDGRALIARHNEASGAETLKAHKSMYTKGQLTVASQGLDAGIEFYSAMPNRSAQKLVLPGVGEILSGFDGTTAWSMNPMQGPQVFDGDAADRIRSESEFLGALRGPEQVTSATTVEKTEMGGTPCYKVKLVWKSGRESFDCYAVDSGLLVGSVQTTESPMGSMEATTLLSEYKDFGGRKVPTKLVQSSMGQEQVVTITAIEYDSVPDSVFEAPPAVKAILEKKP
ncbi:MAG TPA: hypothetical protein VFG84_03405 [Gemmatimonadaceae bacterium]|nr:hypothetical protein [Gemmatimonadaceae bacterium]